MWKCQGNGQTHNFLLSNTKFDTPPTANVDLTLVLVVYLACVRQEDMCLC